MLELLLALVMPPAGEIVRASTAEVVSGDTLRVDGREIRLWGLIVPQPGVACADTQVSDAPYPCEAAARDILQDRVDGLAESIRLLSLRNDPDDPDAQGLRCQIVGEEPNGRAIGRCEVFSPACFSHGAGCTDDWTDLGRLVIASGAGAARREEAADAYDREEGNACYALLGVWGVQEGAGVVAPISSEDDC